MTYKFVETYQKKFRISEKATANIKSEYPEGIPAQGVDSLRFALLKYDAQQVDIRMDVIRFSYTVSLTLFSKLLYFSSGVFFSMLSKPK